MKKWLLGIVLVSIYAQAVNAEVVRLRLFWRSNTSTTMTIAWDQKSGSNPLVIYSENDPGNSTELDMQASPTHSNQSKGMNNFFCELTDLKPNQVYYFLIKDSEGVSRKYSFRTAPNEKSRMSIIAGGDSRNHRDIRQYTNVLVSKLRADVVMFSGDMTNADSNQEWKNWFDDWQLTIAEDGRITPIMVARGNHEMSNKTLAELFFLPNAQNYYSLSFGNGLLHAISLNSLIAPGGDQKNWLQKDLSTNVNATWKIAQYHFPMRPHNSRKPENIEQSDLWCPIFEKYQLQLAIESDAHLAKITYPIVRDKTSSAHEGFRRDDKKGTTYIGEGGWGAPLRANNDEKIWTKKSGSFNQIKWIYVTGDQLRIKTIIIENYQYLTSLNDSNRFSTPSGLRLWTIDGLDEYVIKNQKISVPDLVITDEPEEEEIIEFSLKNFDYEVSEDNIISITWQTDGERPDEAFLLERSLNGGEFVKLKDFHAQGKTIGNSYKYVDNDRFHGEVAYRLKKRNQATRATLSLSEFDFVRKKPKLKVSREKLVLNSLQAVVTVKFNAPYEGNISALLVNNAFKVLDKQLIPAVSEGPGILKFKVADLSPGTYTILIKLDGEILKKLDLVKT